MNALKGISFLLLVTLVAGGGAFAAPLALDTDYIMATATLKPYEDANGIPRKPNPDTKPWEWDLFPNTITDSDEFAVIKYILANVTRPGHDGVHDAWNHNVTEVMAEMEAIGGMASLVKDMYGPALALYLTLGDTLSLDALNALLSDSKVTSGTGETFQLDPVNFDMSQANILGPDADPDLDGLTNAMEYALIPGIGGQTGGVDSAKRTAYIAAIFSPAAPILSINFDTLLTDIVNQATGFPKLTPDPAASSYNPATRDVNGPAGAANGILDSDELAVLASILNNPNNPRFWDTCRAYAANACRVEFDLAQTLELKPTDDSYNLPLVVAYSQVFGGMITLGDANSFASSKTLAEARTTNPVMPVVVDVANYDQSQVDVFSLTGDPDGDGSDNGTEYAAISGLGGPSSAKRAEYINNMFTPAGCDFGVATSGYIRKGQDVVLAVPGTGTGFAWSYDGAPLINGVDYSGTRCQWLTIYNIQPDQGGVYSCTYDDGSKATVTYSVVVRVSERVPAAGFWGLFALVAALGVMGVLRQRRYS